MKKLSRQAKAKLDKDIKHRINVGCIAIKSQIGFFKQHFSEVKSNYKKDSSRVTFADFAISENIFSDIGKYFKNDELCTEEMDFNDKPIKLKSDFSWILDPIDGTNNFALGFPICGISLSLMFQGIPIYGFVYNYSTNQLYEGGEDFGLICNSKKIEEKSINDDEDEIIGVQFPLKKNTLDKIIPILERYKIRALGSSTLLALLVRNYYLIGSVDMRAKIWDISAVYAFSLGTNRNFHFIENNPFPLEEFHPKTSKCPHIYGDKRFLKLIHELIN